jgi:hypothetical protein
MWPTLCLLHRLCENILKAKKANRGECMRDEYGWTGPWEREEVKSQIVFMYLVLWEKGGKTETETASNKTILI